MCVSLADLLIFSIRADFWNILAKPYVGAQKVDPSPPALLEKILDLPKCVHKFITAPNEVAER